MVSSLAVAVDTPISIDLGADGHDLEYDDNRNVIYVSVPSQNEIVIIDVASLTIQNQIPVSAEPRGLDLSSDNTKLYIALNGNGSVGILDLTTNIVTDVLVDQLGDLRTWDVEETESNRIFVSANPGSSGSSFIVEVTHDEFGNILTQQSRVDDVVIRTAPTFATSPDNDFLYVGDTSITNIYKLDLNAPDTPVVLTADRDITDGNFLTISPDGSFIHTRSNTIVRSDSLTRAGALTAGGFTDRTARTLRGPTAFSSNPDIFFVANNIGDPNETEIIVYDASTFKSKNSFSLPCPNVSNLLNDFLILSDDENILILASNLVCGITTDRLVIDSDLDGVADIIDNCPNQANVDQLNLDGDEFGDACDAFPDDASNGVVVNPDQFEIELGGEGHDAIFDDSRNVIYVSIPFKNEIAVIDAITLQLKRKIQVRSQPRGLDLNSDNSKLYIALENATEVGIVDLNTNIVSEVLVDQLGTPLVMDVEIVGSNRIFVSASDRASNILEVTFDELGNVLTQQNIGGLATTGVFAASPDNSFLYLGGSTDGLLKLDLNQSGIPVVLTAGSEIEDSYDLEISPSGSHIHTASGQIIRADSLLQAGRVSVTSGVSPGGLARYGNLSERFFTADIDRVTDLYRITVFKSNNYKNLGSFSIPCLTTSSLLPKDFLVSSNDTQFILLSEDRLCGVMTNFASEDSDGDSVFGISDNCPNIANADQLNSDGDEFGDACDPFPNDAINIDSDGDSVPDTSDNCPEVENPDQSNADSDFLGDVCDSFPNDNSNGGGTVPNFSTIRTAFPVNDPLLDLEYDSDRNVIYASVPTLNEVVILNTSNFNIQRRIAVGSEPRGLDLSQDKTKLYIALRGAGAIAVLDLVTESVTEIVVGEELDTPLAGDVEEVTPNRLFVAPNTGSSGFGFLAEVVIDDDGNVVSKQRISSANLLSGGFNLFETSPDDNFLYLAGNPLRKLDLTQPGAPSVLTGSASGDLQVSPGGFRLHASGTILNTDDFTQEFLVTGTHTEYSSAGDQFYSANASGTGVNTITIYESNSASEISSFDVSCNVFGNSLNDFVVLQNDEVFLTLRSNLLCGVRTSDLLADTDSDSVIDLEDNCPEISNSDQTNSDGDEFGDVCDPVPNDPNNFLAQDLFPLEPFTAWTYLVDNSVLETLTVLGGTRNVNGFNTIGVADSLGAIDYFTNDNDGVKRHLFVDTVGDTVTLIPPAKLLNARPAIGDVINNSGTAQFNIAGIGILSVPYTYTSTVVGIESVTVPFGTFSALRVDTQLTISGTSNGFFINTVSNANDWFVEGVGIVREVDRTDGVTTTSELQSIMLPPEIVSPLTGTILTDGSVTVSWDSMGLVPTNWFVGVGNDGAVSNLGHSGVLSPSAVSAMITGLPVDGSSATIYLYALVNGVWTELDTETVTMFAGPPPAQPEITSPLTGDTLTSGSVSVSWDAMGTVPTNWAVRAGTTGPGSQDLAAPAVLGSGATGDTLTGLPTDGSTFTISLYALQNGVWSVVDSEQVTAFTAPAPAQPEITSPLTGDTLTSGSVSVSWDAMGTVPTNWAVRAGTTGPGSQDLAAPAVLGSGATGDTLTGLPTDGSTFTISLYALQNGVWSVVDSEQVTAFTAPAPAQPEITSPLTGDTLTSGSVSVSWDAMGTVPTNWAVRAGTTGPGSQDLAAPAVLGPGATGDTLTGLPTDGSTFTISLYALQNGVWSVVDSEQVTAFTAPAPAQPEITSPLTGDTLTSTSITVTWDAMGTVPTNWAVRAGTTGPGSQDLAAPAVLGPGATGDTLTGLPTDGSTFTISLYALQNGVWSVVDSEQVTAFTAPAPAQPEITSPLTGDTLTSTSITVTWDAMGTVPTNWAVRAGTTGPGSQDLAAPAVLGPGATGDTLTGLPTDGSTFTISLYALQNGVWSVVDSEQVTAFTAPAPAQPEITSPLTGDTLTSGSVSVSWDAMGTVPTNWAVRAGTTGPGSQDLAAPAVLGSGATGDTLTGLPTDGSTFTISLYALQNGVWSVVDSEQVTAFTAPAPAQPEITSPLTGDTLTSTSITVTWDAMGTVPTNWAVRAGTTGPGSQDLASPPVLSSAASSGSLTGLPADGSTFTISLYALQNGVWSVVDSEQVTGQL